MAPFMSIQAGCAAMAAGWLTNEGGAISCRASILWMVAKSVRTKEAMETIVCWYLQGHHLSRVS